MKYLIVRFHLSPNTEVVRDLLADTAGEAGFESFEETSAGLNGYVQEQLFDRQALDEGIASFPIPDTKIDYSLEEAEDKDWNQAWEDEGFDPIVVKNKCIIYDAKRPLPDFTSLSPGALSIAIDARQAFGTGTHETTRMIVETLLSIDLHDKRVLDCGCGTGILGIAASKMGASSIVAYDIDEWSVENTSHNAAINQAENIEVLLGDAHVLSHVSGVFDIVMANINRNTLLADMHAFKDVMASGAYLILSGFYEDDIPMLVNKASELGLEYHSKRSSGEWRCLVFR